MPKGSQKKYNRAIINAAIVNLAYHCEFGNGGVTIKEVYEYCPPNSCTIDTINTVVSIFRAKNILEYAGEKDNGGRRGGKEMMYKLSPIGKQLLSKCNSELAILFDLITSN